MRVLLPFAAAALLALAALGLGRRMIGRGRLDRPCSGVLGLSYAVGIAVVSIGVFAAGLGGLLTPGPILGLLAAAVVLGLPGLRLAAVDLVGLVAELRPRSRVEALGLAWAATLLFCGAVGALAPPRYNDAVLYHLPLAQRFADAGRLVHVSVVETPTGAYPLGVELLFAVVMSLGGDTAPALVELASGTFLLLLLLGEASAAAGRGAGLAVAAAFLSATTYQFLFQAGNIDHTFILVAAAMLPLLTGGRAGLAGLAAGACAGMKPLLGFLPLLAGLLLHLPPAWRRHLPRPGLARFALIGMLVASTWPAWRWAITGNPIYPLIWGGHDCPPEVLARLKPLKDQGRYHVFDIILQRITEIHPVALALANGPLLLLLTPFLFTRPVRRAAPIPVAALAMIGAAVLYIYSRDRFILLALAQAPQGLALAWSGLRLSGRWVARGAATVLTLGAVLGLLFSVKLSASNLPYTLGLETRDHFLLRWFPDYAFVREANRLVPRGDVVLRMCKQDLRYYHSVYQVLELPSLAVERGRVFETAASLRSLLAAHDVTHVIDCGNLGSLFVSPAEEARFRQRIGPRLSQGKFTLYRLE